MLSAAAFAAAAGTAQAANDRTAQGNDAILDLGRLGLKPLDAGHDNYSVLQSAFDSASAGNGPVIVIPPGNYRISRPLRINHPLTLLGGGAFDMNAARSGTVIVAEGFSEPVLSIGPAVEDRLRGFCIAGLLFDCSHKSNGMSLRQCADFSLSRIGVRAATGFGLEFRNTWDAVVTDAFVSECGAADASLGAIDIAGETLGDNTNSLHFIGARVESSRGPSLIVHPPAPGVGPQNNIQFVASKFHHPAGDGSTPPTPNLILHPAQAIGFHGAQIFDSGKGFPVIEFGSGRAIDSGYTFFGCDIDVRTGDALFGGDIGPGHQFFGCTLRADPGAHEAKPFHRAGSDQAQRIKSLNALYRIAT
jgi:hypothetical protein